MASIDPSLLSKPEEQKWVAEINEILNNQLQINHETPSVSVFKVPETLTTNKPEAFEPKQIGLGPIHHFQSQPYKKMEQKKLAVVQKVLQDYKIKDYELIILDKVRKLVPVIRSCYDMFLPTNDDTLAWVFTIDGLFLLNLFHSCNSQMQVNNNEESRESDDFLSSNSHSSIIEVSLVIETEQPKVGQKRRLVSQDVMMLENQIPFKVLKEIEMALHSSGNSSNSANNFSTSIFRTFCEIHSPLELCSKSQAPTSVEHVLHYMYHSIVKNVFERPVPVTESIITPFSVYTFATNIPQAEIVQAYEQTISILETFSQSKTLIPSASKLHHKVGFSFISLEKYEGIQNIRVDGNDIYLPSLTLNTDSEVILRNLVAYETLIGKSHDFPLTDYVNLMCGLIVDAEDVKLLKNKKVIRGDLGDAEVAKLFTEMSSSLPTIKTKGKSELQEVIDDINKVYESGLSVKTYLLLKKLAGWLLVVLKAIGGFVEASWKIVAFVVGIVTVFYLVWQAYCDSFSCDITTVTLLPYSST